jgi:hypothetical protein
MFGVYNKLGQSRLVKMNIKDKQAYKSSIEKILQLDFESIVVSHGNHIKDPKTFRTTLEKTL